MSCQVTDYQGRILTINPKFGGASHDAFVFENSNINFLMKSLHRAGESVWLLGKILVSNIKIIVQ